MTEKYSIRLLWLFSRILIIRIMSALENGFSFVGEGSHSPDNSSYGGTRPPSAQISEGGTSAAMVVSRSPSASNHSNGSGSRRDFCVDRFLQNKSEPFSFILKTIRESKRS